MKISARFLSCLAVSGALLAAPSFAQTPPPADAKSPAATAPAAEPAKSPKIVAAQAIRDVGKVAQGEKVEVTFEVRNEGTAELVLSDVRPTCGCTVAKFDAKIAPGASGKIEAAVDTSDFHGPIAKTITVLSNDATTPRLTLTIKADIQQLVHMQPGFARFSFVQGQEPVTNKQWLWAEDFKDFRVLSVKSPYEYVTASFREAKPDERRSEDTSGARQWVVDATIAPDAAVGALRDFLVIETNHPKQKEIRIPITGFVRPILSVTPAVADFGAVELKDTAKDLSIIVTNFGKEPIEITGVTTGVAGAETSWKALEGGKRFEVRVSIPPTQAKGPIDSSIQIETSSKVRPTIDVPLKGKIS